MRNKILRTYSVVICIISVVAFIIAGAGFTGALIDRTNLDYSSRYDKNLSSYENFKMDAMKSVSKDQAFIPDDASLKKMYDDAKEDNRRMISHRNNRSILVNGIVIIISIILFVVHWLILRQVSSEA